MKTNLFYWIVLSLFCSAVYAQNSTFEGLGYIYVPTEPWNAPFSQANGVSYDGSVVIGVTTSLYGENLVVEAYRWAEESGMKGLGSLLESNLFFSFARAVSDDGTTIVGYSNSASPEIGWEPFRWTESDGITGLGDLVPENYSGEACDVSANGSVIVGKSNSTSECFLWEDGEMQRIVEEGTFGEAWGVSTDGSVIVGHSIIDNAQQAFRWTEETGMRGLGYPNPYGMGGYSVAFKVSGDGTTIVGFQQYGIPEIPYSVFEAFRWTEETGRVSLGHLSDVLISEASDVSDDGSTVVGYAHAGSGIGQRAFIWTEEYGMQNLQELLETEYGLDLTGWTLVRANAISGDGTTIVGDGINPEGNIEAWRVVLGNPTGGGCLAPESLSVENNTGTTVEFSWSPANGETNGYNWYVMNIGDFPDSDNAVDSGTTEPRVNFANATGLTPNTIYSIFIQTNCNEDAQSDYGIFMIVTSDMGTTEFENQMVLYPNPTTGIINLKTKEKINSVSIYNLAGQKVSFNSLNLENTSIDISNLSNGTYLVEVLLNDKSLKRYKVIKK